MRKIDNDTISERDKLCCGKVLRQNLFSVTRVQDLQWPFNGVSAASHIVLPEKPHQFRLPLITRLWKGRQRLGGVRKRFAHVINNVKEVPGQCFHTREPSKTILKFCRRHPVPHNWEDEYTFLSMNEKRFPHWSFLDNILLAYSIFPVGT